MKAARIFVVRERRQREALKMGGIPGHRPGGASEYASTAHLPLTANNNDSTSTLGGTDDRRGPSPGTGVFNPHASDVELVAPNARPGASSTSLAPDRYAYEPRVGAQQWDDKGKAVGDGYGYQYGYGGGDRERRGGNGYDDPYAPSSFSSGPSSQTPRFQPPSTTSSTATITAQDQPFRPPSGPPPPSQYPPQDQPAYPIQKRIPPPAAPQPIRKAPISLLQSQTSSTPPVPLLPPPNAGAQLNSSPGFPNPQMPSSNVSTNQDSYPNPFGETSPEAHQTSFNINPTPIATGTRRYDEQGGDIEPESPFADVNAIRVQPPSIHSTQEPSIPGSAPGSQGGNLSAIPPSSSHSSPSSGASSSLPSSLPSAVSSLSPTASGQGQTSQRVAQQQQQFLGVKRYQLTDPGSGSASAETSPSGGNSSFYSADSRNNSPAKERADDEGLR
ncbi:hypothetical protein SISSUDRAFT_530922 [Sistotremastrum suecicum HHB10207 ss-3]|uniref:Uncharacterized protein n=1 Tax=Sistotremastrum suecicum HHB10207 ss-3 TaxID=1314776 RepID=A0A166F3S8_9AGAM|nr:hypothetical protein SISSUDRAFT_530922 [Sistotremastrum suecicum HHB10207 ss-3]